MHSNYLRLFNRGKNIPDPAKKVPYPQTFYKNPYSGWCMQFSTLQVIELGYEYDGAAAVHVGEPTSVLPALTSRNEKGRGLPECNNICPVKGPSL